MGLKLGYLKPIDFSHAILGEKKPSRNLKKKPWFTCSDVWMNYVDENPIF